MEIIQNKALKLRVKEPDVITQYIPRSRNIGNNEVLVNWDYDEVAVLRNIGIKKAPSPIMGRYAWTGHYKPFDHQRHTAAFLTMNRRAFCLSEMGCGKTVSAIWAADYLMTKGIIKKCLIVCPVSIMDSAWRADLFRTAMHRRVDVAYGAKEKRKKIIKQDLEFTIINYDGVEVVAQEIAQKSYDLIIIDELNHYKNAQIKRWKIMNKLIKSDTWVWGLTGSPASQSPADAYGIAKLIVPANVPRTFGAFRDMVMEKFSMFKYIPKANAEETVFKVLQPAIRYTKEECLDLPDRVYTTREVPLTSQQLKYYKELKTDMVIQAAGEEINAVNAAVAINKLLQLSGGSVYSNTKEVLEFDVSNRLKELLDIIEESKQKVIIFANFRHNMGILLQFMLKNNIGAEVIHGGVPIRARTDIFNSFQTSDDLKVLIIQPRAAAHGVTLTSASTIVWWGLTSSYDTYIQANDRIHRMGQKCKCTIIHLIGSPVEKKLLSSLQSRKQNHVNLLSLYKEELK